MRTAFVQFNYEGVELSYEARYKAEPTGLLYDIEAWLVMVGPDQSKPTIEQRILYVFWAQVWRHFYDALVEADAEKYPTPDLADVVNFGKDRY